MHCIPHKASTVDVCTIDGLGSGELKHLKKRKETQGGYQPRIQLMGIAKRKEERREKERKRERERRKREERGERSKSGTLVCRPAICSRNFSLPCQASNQE